MLGFFRGLVLSLVWVFFHFGFPAYLHGSARLYATLDFKMMAQTCEIN